MAGIEIEFGAIDAASPTIQRLSKELLEAAKSSGRFADEVTAASGKADEAFKKIPPGANKAKGSMDALAQAGASLKSEIAALASVAAVSAFFKSSVAAIAEQERATFRLTQALRINGEASTENVRGLVAFSEQLQRTTGVSDDQAQGLLALARTFTTSIEQARRMTEVSIDLAAVMGTQPVDAMRQLAGASAGMVRELAKVNPEVRNLSAEQLKAGLATELIAQKVQGTAAALHNTFSGSLVDAKNQLNDFQEEIGAGLVPAIGPLLSALRKVFETFRLLGVTIAAVAASIFTEVAPRFVALAEAIGSSMAAVRLAVAGNMAGARDAAATALKQLGTITSGSLGEHSEIWNAWAADVAAIQSQAADTQVQTATRAAVQVTTINRKLVAEIKKRNEEMLAARRTVNDKVAQLEIEALQLTGQGLEAERRRIQAEKEERLRALDEIAKKAPETERKVQEARILTMQNAALAEAAALEQFDETAKALKGLGDQVAGDIAGAFGNAFADMIFEGKNLEEQLTNAFQNIAKRAVAALIEIAVQAAITQAATGGVSGGAGAAGGGGGFAGIIGKIGGFLQAGGIVKRPGVFALAEGGEPEAVAPLSRLSTLIGQAVRAGGGGGGGVTVTVQQENHFTSPQGFSDEQVAQVMRRIAAFTRNGAAEGGELVKSILARQGKVSGQSV